MPGDKLLKLGLNRREMMDIAIAIDSLMVTIRNTFLPDKKPKPVAAKTAPQAGRLMGKQVTSNAQQATTAFSVLTYTDRALKS